MQIENAIIKSATLSTEDHGCLSSWLHLEFPGSGQGFGGYALYLPSGFQHHAKLSHAGHWIWRVMEIAGVSNWRDLPGKTIRVRRHESFGKIRAIGHIIKDDWFDPSVDFKGGRDAES